MFVYNIMSMNNEAAQVTTAPLILLGHQDIF